MTSSIALDAALHDSVSHIHGLLIACELLYRNGDASFESLKLIEDALLFVYYRDKPDLEAWRASARAMMRKRGFPAELLDAEQEPVSSCPDCGKPQYPCPSGVTCENGHGY